LTHPDCIAAARSLTGEKRALGFDRLSYSQVLVPIESRRSTDLDLASVAGSPVSLLQNRHPVSRRDHGLWQPVRAQVGAKLVSSDVNGIHGEVYWTPIRYSQTRL